MGQQRRWVSARLEANGFGPDSGNIGVIWIRFCVILGALVWRRSALDSFVDVGKATKF